MNSDTHIYLYDSGFGTLTLAQKLLSMGFRVTLFADLKNAPYGNKPPELVKEIARTNIENLHSLTPPGSKSIVIVCCNTADICGLELWKKEGVFLNTPDQITMGVVNPAIGALVADLSCEMAFIYATQNSVDSGRFMEIKNHRPSMDVFQIPFDGLAPAIDARNFMAAMMNIFGNIAKRYPNIAEQIKDLKTKPRVGPFCTHFALVQPYFQYAHRLFFNHEVEFVDQAGQVAEMVVHEVGTPAATENHLGRLFTTGDPATTTVHFRNHQPLRPYWHMFQNGPNFEQMVVEPSPLFFTRTIASQAVGNPISTKPAASVSDAPKQKITAEGLVIR